MNTWPENDELITMLSEKPAQLLLLEVSFHSEFMVELLLIVYLVTYLCQNILPGCSAIIGNVPRVSLAPALVTYDIARIAPNASGTIDLFISSYTWITATGLCYFFNWIVLFLQLFCFHSFEFVLELRSWFGCRPRGSNPCFGCAFVLPRI